MRGKGKGKPAFRTAGFFLIVAILSPCFALLSFRRTTPPPQAPFLLFVLVHVTYPTHRVVLTGTLGALAIVLVPNVLVPVPPFFS
ncbi:hypothetical protein F5X99DRAFT_402577 [Biscogniauxia marginata]|nr:hypothetical protein F5X99DRAFT_402577 [Biscogniauxia marginata]